ncbi:MAG: pilus assembly protein [Nitrosomonadales bacterium]|nr:pilus assembly protein [Nitrosomonadales bacterium]
MSVKSKQGGATLVVGLVMLVVLTLLVLSAIRSGNINMRIVGNMQAQEETATASVQATEQVISTNFTAAPASQVIAVDINGDGNTEYTASVPVPVCTASLAVTNADLNPANPAEASCISSAAVRQAGISYRGKDASATGQSWCYQQQWEVQAQVTDDRTSATATSRQGVSLRVPAGTLCP